MPFSSKRVLLLLGVLTFLHPWLVSASDETSSLLNNTAPGNDDSIGSEYYTIADPEESDVSTQEQVETLFSPLNTIANFVDEVRVESEEQSLLRWVRHESSHIEAPEKYQRAKHFGTWIRDPSKKTCLNIRGLVLQRDAQGDLSYSDTKHCRITGAHWVDPYTNKHLYSANDIQIDHMVPLKNAYISGAWEWDYAKRCAYTNFMGNEFHLLPVLGYENSRKGDRSPDSYLPPSKEYVCQYIVNWLKIKMIWKLKLGKQEALSIENLVQKYNCNTHTFEISKSSLMDQRFKSKFPPMNCHKPNKKGLAALNEEVFQ